MAKYVIEKLKNNGKSFSIRQFISKYKRNYIGSYNITTSLIYAQKYKTILGIRRKIEKIKEEDGSYRNSNLVITEIDDNGIIMHGHISAKPKSRKLRSKKSKKILTRWQLIDLD